MNTDQILKLALEAAGLSEIPADSGVVFPGDNIKRVMVGVDVEAAEILIARHLGFDAVITHHPRGGRPALDLAEAMDNQIDRMVQAGVAINKAQKALVERKEQVERARHVENYGRAVSAARLLGMPYIAVHTPADILAERTVQEHLDRDLDGRPKATLADVIAALEGIPEYRLAPAKPKIRVGAEQSFAGRVVVTMAGGTSGGEKVALAYFEAGVGTLVVMHMPDDVIEAVKRQEIGNVVIAGHMASDSVGVNRLIAVFEQNGLEITRASGVIEPAGE